ADIVDCLERILPGTLREKALLERFRGNFAESQWQLSKAVGHYEAAASMMQNEAGVQHDLARVNLLLLDTGNARAHLRRFREGTAVTTRLQKKSLNISQTHLGKIIDDYCLDQDRLQ